jgi:hypothetical protein
MTEDKDFKRIVRDRAARTGESYQRARQQLRGEPADDLDAIEAVAWPDWPDAVRREGDRIADLALRMADGKPAATGSVMSPELRADASMVDREAARPDATEETKMRASALADQLDRLASVARQNADPPRQDEDDLARRINGRLAVALVARAKCRAALELNARDHVARQAYDQLTRIAARLVKR